jgi:TonB family protein
MSRGRSLAGPFFVLACVIAATAVAAQAPLRRTVEMPILEYPTDALERGIGGVVVINLAVNPGGFVTTGEVASGPEELRVAAFKVAMALKFEPRDETTPLTVSVAYQIRSDTTVVNISWGDKLRRYAAGRTFPLNRGPVPVVWEQNTINRDVPAPKKVKDVAVAYPAEALEKKVQGAVVLEAQVDEEGNVTVTRLVSSIPLLDEAAIDAVNQWKYEPSTRNGIAVPVVVTVMVNFEIKDPPIPGSR